MTPDEARKAQDLARMKRVATGLLVAVAVAFVAFRWLEETRDWASFPRAMFEAAMVGALADWFAVTALFRHPLWLPIPHTAIIPKRKDEIGRSLGEFVQGNFLTPEVVTSRIESADVGRKLGEWVARPENAKRIGGAAADVLRGGLEVVDDRDVGSAVEALVEQRIQATPVAPLAARAIDVAIDGGHHQKLLDSVLLGLGGFLADNRLTFRARLDEESPWWVPERIDDRVFEKIYDAVQRFITDVVSHPRHEVRDAIDERVALLAQRLRSDPELLERGEQLKREILAHPEVRAWMASLWGEAKATALAATDDPNSELRQRLDHAVAQLGTRLSTDTELQAKVDAWVQRSATYVVDRYRGEVADIIAETVERWDAADTTERLELQVGRDLQFIRINGTIVGGLAGLTIHTITHFVF